MLLGKASALSFKWPRVVRASMFPYCARTVESEPLIPCARSRARNGECKGFKAVVDSAGVETCIEALLRHSSQESLQREGCRFLERTMRTDLGTRHGPSMLNHVAYQRMRVYVIINAIKNHLNNTSVQEEAIKALGTLALDSVHQKVCFYPHHI